MCVLNSAMLTTALNAMGTRGAGGDADDEEAAAGAAVLAAGLTSTCAADASSAACRSASSCALLSEPGVPMPMAGSALTEERREQTRSGECVLVLVPLRTQSAHENACEAQSEYELQCRPTSIQEARPRRFSGETPICRRAALLPPAEAEWQRNSPSSPNNCFC